MILAASLSWAQPLSEYSPPAGRQLIEKAFPEATELQPMEGNRAIQKVYAGDELIGYAYQSLDFVQTPAYSGKPLNAMVESIRMGHLGNYLPLNKAGHAISLD